MRDIGGMLLACALLRLPSLFSRRRSGANCRVDEPEYNSIRHKPGIASEVILNCMMEVIKP